jgi:hypothetical protein
VRGDSAMKFLVVYKDQASERKVEFSATTFDEFMESVKSFNVVPKNSPTYASAEAYVKIGDILKLRDILVLERIGRFGSSIHQFLNDAEK